MERVGNRLLRAWVRMDMDDIRKGRWHWIWSMLCESDRIRGWEVGNGDENGDGEIIEGRSRRDLAKEGSSLECFTLTPHRIHFGFQRFSIVGHDRGGVSFISFFPHPHRRFARMC